ncbi:MAG TPA: hypothetical protein VFY64_11365 [Nitrososphaeraceae archaeon]|nr:hypothetical protein [Nitrososphaeraceae archaeon]
MNIGITYYIIQQDIFCFYLLDSSHSYVIFIELLNNRVIVTVYIPMTATGFLVFYRFKAMNKEETEKSKDEWNRLKNSLPSGIELVGEYVHAWGTEYNGFLLFASFSLSSTLLEVIPSSWVR